MLPMPTLDRSLSVTHGMKPSAAIFSAVRRASSRSCGGGVVDHQDGQMVAFLDGAQLAQQPGAIVLRDFLVAPGAGVPGAVQRFGGHHLHLAGQLGDQLEPPVEDQLNARKTLVQGVDHAHQPLLLGLFVKVLGQAVGVERVQEEAPVAL